MKNQIVGYIKNQDVIWLKTGEMIFSPSDLFVLLIYLML
jgi:hypothetical protein